MLILSRISLGAGLTNVKKVLHGPLPKGKRSTKPWESAGIACYFHPARAKMLKQAHTACIRISMLV